MDRIRYVIRSTVTGLWLTGWDTSQPLRYTPIWGDKARALEFTPASAVATVHRIRTEHGTHCKPARESA